MQLFVQSHLMSLCNAVQNHCFRLRHKISLRKRKSRVFITPINKHNQKQEMKAQVSELIGHDQTRQQHTQDLMNELFIGILYEGDTCPLRGDKSRPDNLLIVCPGT